MGSNDSPIIGGHRAQQAQGQTPPVQTRARSNAVSNTHITGEQFLAEAHTASSAVYFKGQANSKDLPVGWTREQLPGATPQERQNLQAQMEKCDAEYLRSPSGQKFLAFRGTEMQKGMMEALRDWKNNAQQAIGLESEKYKAAAFIGDKFKNMPEVAFTGHSLGGGLAKLAAEKASTPVGNEQGVDSKVCVAFNAAPVNPITYMRDNLATGNHLRTTIHVVNENDILNRMVKGGKTAAFSGEMLGDRDKPENSMIVLDRGAGSVMGASGHGNKNLVHPGGADRGDRVQFYPLENAQGQSVSASQYDRFVPSRLMADRALAAQALETVDRAQGPTLAQHRGQGVGR